MSRRTQWNSCRFRACFTLAKRDFNAEVKGMQDIDRDEQPPVWPVFVSFRIMVALGILFILLMLWGFWRRNRLAESPRFLKIMMLAIPLPYLACWLGWIVTEVGRQPWIVYGVMRTSEAHSSAITSSDVGATLAVFIVLYGAIGALGFRLMARVAKTGPGLDEAENKIPDHDEKETVK